MPTVIGRHDVKDTDHWLASPKREEVFTPLGVTKQSLHASDRGALLLFDFYNIRYATQTWIGGAIAPPPD